MTDTAKRFDDVTTEDELDDIFGSGDAILREFPEDHASPIGALQQWHRELQARFCGRTTQTTDTLRLAAAWEAQGLEQRALGLTTAAAYCFERASEIIVDAAAERAA